MVEINFFVFHLVQGLPDEKAWGKKRKGYYWADEVSDDDYGKCITSYQIYPSIMPFDTTSSSLYIIFNNQYISLYS